MQIISCTHPAHTIPPVGKCSNSGQPCSIVANAAKNTNDESKKEYIFFEVIIDKV